jgi:hypothetical protein
MACSYLFNAKARLACSTEVSTVTFGASGAVLSGINWHAMAGDHSSYLRSHLEDEGIVMRLCERTVNGEKVSQSASPYFLNRTMKVAHL